MADQSIRGRFVWHDLMTPDVAGAHGFYSKALGWTTQAFDQDPSYQMFAAGSGPIGGSVAEPSGSPHWLPYIGTPDVAATIEQAKSLGGNVVKGATSIPNGGTYAILSDPQGAAFGVYASSSDPGKETAPKRGEFSWHELATTDYRAAFDFYAALFGWERIQEHDMGPMGVYFIFGAKGVQKGGIFNKPAEMKGPAAWLGYVRVKDVNQSVKKVKAARGALINGPMEVPGGDWIAQFTDPYGAMFAVHTLASDMKAAAPAAAAPAAAEPAAPAAVAKPAKKVVKAAAKVAGVKAVRKAAKKAKRKVKKAAVKKKAVARKVARKKVAKKRAAVRKTRRAVRKVARKAKRAVRKVARKAKRTVRRAGRGARKAARKK